MRSIEISAKTVEDAVETALRELNVSRDDVSIEVLEEPSKGFFGILGVKMAKVRVTLKEKPAQIAQKFLEDVCKAMGMNVKVDVREEEDYLYLNISGSQLGILIGHRGETLDSLQYLTSLAVNRKIKQKVHVIIDVEKYRKRREQTLIKLAQRLAHKVKRTGNNVTLEPMNPHERKIIHTALQGDPSIYTYSEGEEPHRKVIISLKNKAK